MKTKDDVKKKSLLDQYRELSGQKKPLNETSPAKENTPKRPEQAELDSKKKIEIKTATRFVFPEKALNLLVYDALLPIMEAAASVEQSTLDETARKKQAITNAATLALIFNDPTAALSFLKNYERGYIGNQLVHDACLITFPSDDKWNADVWKDLIQKHIKEPNMLKIFQNASAIEVYIGRIRKELEAENTKKIDERFSLSYSKEYDVLLNMQDPKTQMKETQKEYEEYIKAQLKFPQRGKPTEEQKIALDARLKNPTDGDKKERERLIKKHSEKSLTKYMGIDISTKEGFVKAMLEKSKKDIDAAKANENKAIFSKDTAYEKLETYSKLSVYKNYYKNIPAAQLFSDLNMSEAAFEEYLTLKPKDNPIHIPDVSIDGESLGHRGYILKKLNPGDPRAAVLGKLTGCCQSLSDVGAPCARHGITDERGGFYVLCEIDPKTKKEQIVAQCWAWRGENNSIVFDSVESNFNFRRKEGAFALITDFYTHLADKLVEENGVPRVLVGLGSATPQGLKTLDLGGDRLQDALSDTPVAYTEYRDSNQQRLLAEPGMSLHWLFSNKLIATDQSRKTEQNTDTSRATKSISSLMRNQWIFLFSSCYKNSDINTFIKNHKPYGITLQEIEDWIIERSKKFESIQEAVKNKDEKAFQEVFSVYKQHTSSKMLTLSQLNLNLEWFGLINPTENEFNAPFTADNLSSILYKLNSDKKIIFIKDIVGAQKVKELIPPGNMIFKILDILPIEQRFSFIKDVVGAEQLKKIVTYSKGFFDIENKLPEDKRIPFLLELNIGELSYVLEQLPKKQRTSFMQEYIAKHKLDLERVIFWNEAMRDDKSSKSLWRIVLSSLPEEQLGTVMGMLYKNSVLSSDFIADLLFDALSKEGKEEGLLSKYLSKIAILDNDLATEAIKYIPDMEENEQEVLEIFKKYINQVKINSVLDLMIFTINLSRENCFAIIKDYGFDKVTKMMESCMECSVTLERVPESSRLDVLSKEIGYEKLRELIDKEGLLDIMVLIPITQRPLFSEQLFTPEFLKKLALSDKDGDELLQKIFPEKNRDSFSEEENKIVNLIMSPKQVVNVTAQFKKLLKDATETDENENKNDSPGL